MKNKSILIFLATLAFFVFNYSAKTKAQGRPLNLTGAWQTGTPENQRTLICSEKFYSVAICDVKNKKFSGSYGGSYRLEGDEYVAVMEFHSLNPETVGNEYRGKIELQNGVLIIEEDSAETEWKRLDDGAPGKLAGAWVITGRYRDGQLSERTPGARRTMKILSGTRFQWIAYNVETKQFSGTGGGSYTTSDGKYTENIEFFSRDNSRVGASLKFDFSLEGGRWRHKGLSSQGEPIDEVWTKREKIGL
ncbi:MAG: membrane or secreted protein [Cyclobacteriaceae bacterium]